MKKLYVIEYSRRQNCFHQDELGHVLKVNYENFINGSYNDYQTIGIFESMEECDEFYEKYCAEKWRKRCESIRNK